MEIQHVQINGQKEYDGKPFPLCISPDPSTSADLNTFKEWMSTHQNDLDNMLREYKAVYFRNFPVANVNDFDEVVQASGYKDMPYVGGAAVRTQVTPRVFTSNESPPSEKIPFHHEMSQVPQPPTHLFFYCEIPTTSGGETPLLPSGEVCKQMCAKFPEFMNDIETHGVQYVRVMPMEDDPTSAIGRGWKSTFLTDSKEEAEAKLAELGSTFEWLDNGDLKTVTSVLPAVRVDAGPHRSQEKTFFNSMVAAYTGWNDSRNKGETAVILGNGQPCDAAAMEYATTLMDGLAVSLLWEANDFVLVDNRTAMHSRKPYDPAEKRRVLASLINDPDR
mmetsp:Transcript_8371/g.14189  ORF Transcript_8371/g.14189 Transcript_8371/m.14189 type:complete len:333 (-) Transcript_8371:150-1148(-)